MKNNISYKIHRILSILFSVLLFFFILSFSISLPIYCRPFYYAHIEPLHLSEISGFSKNEIIIAYNEVLDYLTLPNKDFSAGVMKYSLEGESHFADCKELFSLNAWVLIICSASAIILLVLRKKLKLAPFKIGKHSASFYSAICSIAVPLIIGGIGALDFRKAFQFFHIIFFPKKTNWIFNPLTDEIIYVLPEQFFMNCAILIGASILTISIAIILTEKNRMKKYSLV